jgi:hypothetical protein
MNVVGWLTPPRPQKGSLVVVSAGVSALLDTLLAEERWSMPE